MPTMPPALPQEAFKPTQKFAPRFDYDGDSCHPSVAIGRNGSLNGDLKPTGSLTEECRRSAPDRKANTYHRAATRWASGSKYVAHIYAQNFKKDQVLDL